MYFFKESLMKNKKIIELNLQHNYLILSSSGGIYDSLSTNALDVFLNHGKWTNKNLKIMRLECKILKFL
jgi:hypothetical protein